MTYAIRNMILPIESLEPHPRNFRLHPELQVKQLQKSYQRFGQFRSVVAQENEPGKYLMVAGHGIVEAMRKEGVREVRVDVLSKDVSPTEIEAILVADNYLSTMAQDNEEVLAEILQDQQEAGHDIEGLGISKEAFLEMLKNIGVEAVEPAGGLLELLDITIDDPTHKVGAGDIWTLGKHTLLCVHVFKDWAIWQKCLRTSDCLFLPFAGPLVALSETAKTHTFIMVQPDTYIAGHILDRYKDIYGEDTIRKVMTVPHSLIEDMQTDADEELNDGQ